MSLSFLFNWKGKNISASQKLAAYPHLYSFTSTKSVVHWFQIIRNKSFQMYDDDVHQPMSVSTTNKYSKVAKYPTRNIRTPVVLVYGGSDSLVDIRVMLKELPPQTVATEIPHYEHLDFLWAKDVDTQVFQHVFDALDSFTDAEHTKEEYDRYFTVRQESLIGSGFLGHTQRENESDVSPVAEGAEGSTGHQFPQHRAREQKHNGNGTPPRKIRLEESHTMDGVAEVGDSPAAAKLKGIGIRRGSVGSALSFDTFDKRGISVGASKTAGGVVTRSGVAAVTSPLPENGKNSSGKNSPKRK